MLTAGKRLAVFSIREARGGSIWVRAGSAFVNKDGSLNVLLDVLPIDGRLHVREAAEKSDSAVHRGAQQGGYSQNPGVGGGGLTHSGGSGAPRMMPDDGLAAAGGTQ